MRSLLPFALLSLGSVGIRGLDPAAYNNPSGQLTTLEVEERSLEYQARYTIQVLNRAESCFYLENMKVGYNVNIHYIVISTKNGNQLDISMRLKDPNSKMVTFQARRKEGHYENYKINVAGDYEICFNNRYSMYESKKLMWEVDVEGDEQDDENEVMKAAINRTMEEFSEESKVILKTITKVRHNMARGRHQQYWIKSKSSKDSERMETLQGMVDTWSLIYTSLLVTVMVGQVFVLRSFFNEKPTSSKLMMRT